MEGSNVRDDIFLCIPVHSCAGVFGCLYAYDLEPALTLARPVRFSARCGTVARMIG